MVIFYRKDNYYANCSLLLDLTVKQVYSRFSLSGMSHSVAE